MKQRVTLTALVAGIIISCSMSGYASDHTNTKKIEDPEYGIIYIRKKTSSKKFKIGTKKPRRFSAYKKPCVICKGKTICYFSK